MLKMPATTKVKICGITSAEDAAVAVEAGADALGFVLYRKSPRYIHPSLAKQIIMGLPPLASEICVFVVRVISSSPSIPWTTKQCCDPSRMSTLPSNEVNRLSYTPST